jgi:hypothetical protein
LAFWSRVQKGDGCWEWIGPRWKGYGVAMVKVAGGWRVVRVHKVAYAALVGPVPKGLVLDHLCRVRHCVRPDHLEPVTPRENTLRGCGATALNARKEVCSKGHPLAEENMTPHATWRRCRTCQREYDRAYKDRHKQEINARRKANNWGHK